MCLWRTRVSVYPHGIEDGRLRRVALPVVQQAAMEETDQQEVIAQG